MEANTDNSGSASTPEENSSKPMDSKKDVETSPDAKTDQDFPGYPHYPAKEDIMDKRTHTHRVDMNIEELSRSNNTSGLGQRYPVSGGQGEAKEAMTPTPDESIGIKMGTEGDVDKDDLAVLRSIDAGAGTPRNVSDEDQNTDLDIPGSELDDSNEQIGEEDEENNYYSLGGDRQEANEEDPESGPVRE